MRWSTSRPVRRIPTSEALELGVSQSDRGCIADHDASPLEKRHRSLLKMLQSMENRGLAS